MTRLVAASSAHSMILLLETLVLSSDYVVYTARRRSVMLVSASLAVARAHAPQYSRLLVQKQVEALKDYEKDSGLKRFSRLPNASHALSLCAGSCRLAS